HLSVVAGLLGLQSEVASDDACRELLEKSRMRVMAVAHVHEKLCGSQPDLLLDAGEYLRTLTERLFDILGFGQSRLQLTTDIAPVRLAPPALVPLGLIVNELLSNTIKHAFPDGQEGVVHVRLGMDGGRAELTVRDNGVGIGAGAGARLDSLGLELVQGLAGQLGGEVRTDPTSRGVQITVSFPL
ncbi:sensor histidine kinase, partial [Desulfolutivibrio sp.]|uniref:sensor histidine kinase n=1 Tax=Desulfolutivibrio sp. TaxID=2773296 RepID=UPI002F96E5B5